jgi:hypothetical protein
MEILRSIISGSPQTQLLHGKEEAYSVPGTQDFHYDVAPRDPLAELREINDNRNGILSAEVQGIGGMTLEEDLAEHAAIAAVRAQVHSVATQPGIFASTTFRKTSAPPIPQGPRSAEAIATLNHLCQKRAITAEFSYSRVGEQYHQATLRLGDVLLVDEQGRKFSSKKEAKEVMAVKGVEVVKGWIESEVKKNEQGELGGGEFAVGKKRGLDAVPGKKDDSLTEENWVGLLLGKCFDLAFVSSLSQLCTSLNFIFRSLNARYLVEGPSLTTYTEFSQQSKTHEPIYQPYNLITQTFASTVVIGQRPTEPFGNPSTTYASKRAAKAAAARDAVFWLRAEGLLPAAGAGSRKKFRSGSSTDIIAFPLTDSSSLSLPPHDPNTSYASQVQTLAHGLGLQSPEYRLVPAPNTALYSGAAYFSNGTGALAGAVGVVRMVYGRKVAREECAKAVELLLREEWERRRHEVGGI